jgi:hypothetical protein
VRWGIECIKPSLLSDDRGGFVDHHQHRAWRSDGYPDGNGRTSGADGCRRLTRRARYSSPSSETASCSFRAHPSVLRSTDGEVVGRVPTELVPDLVRVDDACNVVVLEDSGHIGTYQAGARLTLVQC